MAQIEIEIKGLKELQNRLNNYPIISAKHIQEAISFSVEDIHRNLRPPTTPVGVTGDLFRAVGRGKYIGPLKGGIKINLDYGVYVHEGTRPHWPPYKEGTPLGRWAKQKGINPYLVARSISRKGTKANPFFKKGIDKAQSNINLYFKKALQKITEELAK